MDMKLTADEIEATGKQVQAPGLKVWSDEARVAALAARQRGGDGKKPKKRDLSHHHFDTQEYSFGKTKLTVTYNRTTPGDVRIEKETLGPNIDFGARGVYKTERIFSSIVKAKEYLKNQYRIDHVFKKPL